MPALEICLLGRFQLLVDGEPVAEQRWSRKKAKLLVKLLALAPQHQMHREQLTGILWPEMEADAALNNLHKIIHAARRALEPELTQAGSRFLLTQDVLVSLAESNLRIDVDEFERQAADAVRTGDTASLETALALHRGDLLEEDLYEDWASLRRERVRLLYQRTLERLAGNLEASRDPRAIETLNRLLATNRANEDAHRRLMTLYTAMGQRHLALQQYRTCCDALRQELDAVPETGTVRLYERLLEGTGTAESNPPALAEATAPAAVAFPSAGPVIETRRNDRRRAMVWAATLIVGVGLGLVAYNFLPRGRPGDAPVPSLAILPLRTKSGPGDLDNAADGITEELINSTSRLQGIRVMARGTVFAYKNRSDAREVGRELKVTTVMFGYLRQEGETATVGLELIDVGDGARLWARKYSAPAENIAPLQRLLTSELTAAVESKLTGRAHEPQKPRQTAGDAEAYRLYLTGRYFWNQRTPDALRKSIEYYQQAIGRDPSYALAYAGLADSYGLLGWESGLPRDYFPRARAAAEKALQFDQSLAEAQTSLAMVSALYDWNWIAAEAQFRRAIELNGGYATAHHWFGVHLGAMGKLDEARRELAAALDLDPLSPAVNVNRGYPALYLRHFSEAIDIFGKALALNTGFAPAHEDLMTAYQLSGNTAAAGKEAVQFLRLSGQADLAGFVERTIASSGYRAGLQVWLQFWEERAARSNSRDFVSPMIPARLAVALGDRDRSFLWLDRAWQQRSPQLVYLAVDPQYDVLRPDPRFPSLLQRIGLPVR